MWPTSGILPLSIIISCSNLVSVAGLVKCVTCYNGCKSIQNCRCDRHSEKSCLGDYCFLELKRVDYGDQLKTYSGASAIFAGCVNSSSESTSKSTSKSTSLSTSTSLSVEPPIDGCSRVDDRSTVKCTCSGRDYCNDAELVNQFWSKNQHGGGHDDHDEVTCCACDSAGQDADVGCQPIECDRKCRGDFCYVDMIKQTQGCGYGYSSIFDDMRTTGNFTDIISQNQTCRSMIADFRVNRFWGRLCACRGHLCNTPHNAYDRDLNFTQGVNKKQMFCHSFVNRSVAPITLDSYRASTYCDGHFCTLTYKTKVVPEITASAILLHMEYELAAGCLLSDSDSNVKTGCTTYSSEDQQTPYLKHCVCDKDYCNSYNLVHDEPASKYLVFVGPQPGAAEITVPGIIFSLVTMIFQYCLLLMCYW